MYLQLVVLTSFATVRETAPGVVVLPCGHMEPGHSLTDADSYDKKIPVTRPESTKGKFEEKELLICEGCEDCDGNWSRVLGELYMEWDSMITRQDQGEDDERDLWDYP